MSDRGRWVLAAAACVALVAAGWFVGVMVGTDGLTPVPVRSTPALP